MQKTLTMKELPESERPYEKCRLYGPGALTDAELIAVILRSGSQGERSTDLADRILNAAPDGLLNLIRLNPEELMSIRGIGSVKAVQLKCMGELSRRISGMARPLSRIYSGPEDIAGHYMEQLRHESREILMMLMFDRKNMFLGDEKISIGTSNSSLISPAEVFRTALAKRAEFIVLLHNHPSGDPSPSKADRDVTRRIEECGKMLEIPLMDHIIIGDKCYYSFCQAGFLKNKGE
ncbi:MAG: DNA repair protein RadC [Clostridiales bacterium]|nr:DNA repair protein RadC [Clostridiales bacterium]